MGPREELCPDKRCIITSDAGSMDNVGKQRLRCPLGMFAIIQTDFILLLHQNHRRLGGNIYGACGPPGEGRLRSCAHVILGAIRLHSDVDRMMLIIDEHHGVLTGGSAKNTVVGIRACHCA